MIRNSLLSLAAALLLTFPVLSATISLADKPNIVTGLALPDPTTVQYDEGFYTIKADCTGPVEWIVLVASTANPPNQKIRIKYKIGSDPKSLDISVPPESCVITVFCYGYADTKLTSAARSDITVQGNTPTPTPTPSPIVGSTPYIVTVIQDPTSLATDNTLISSWAANSAKLSAAGHTPYLKSIKDPTISAWLDAAGKQKKEFGDAVTRAGVPLVVVQKKGTGEAVAAIPCPKNIADLLTALNGGGK